jgi:H+/Cl- antiporter ClcA
MLTNNKKQEELEAARTQWKAQVYAVGAAGGIIFGMLASYLFTRSASEDMEREDWAPEPIPTGQLIALALAALAMIRQIAELGTKPKKK